MDASKKHCGCLPCMQSLEDRVALLLMSRGVALESYHGEESEQDKVVLKLDPLRQGV